MHAWFSPFVFCYCWRILCLCVLRCKKKEEENEKQSWIATLLCQIDTSMHVANANVWRTSVGVHRAEAPAESSSHFIEREMGKAEKVAGGQRQFLLAQSNAFKLSLLRCYFTCCCCFCFFLLCSFEFLLCFIYCLLLFCCTFLCRCGVMPWFFCRLTLPLYAYHGLKAIYFLLLLLLLLRIFSCHANCRNCYAFNLARHSAVYSFHIGNNKAIGHIADSACSVVVVVAL